MNSEPDSPEFYTSAFAFPVRKSRASGGGRLVRLDRRLMSIYHGLALRFPRRKFPHESGCGVADGNVRRNAGIPSAGNGDGTTPNFAHAPRQVIVSDFSLTGDQDFFVSFPARRQNSVSFALKLKISTAKVSSRSARPRRVKWWRPLDFIDWPTGGRVLFVPGK